MSWSVCMRGHDLIPGVTAYPVAVWTWCKTTYCTRTHGKNGDTRWNPVIGRAAGRPGAWEHKRIEWRCKLCNRDRVRQWRAKQKAPVIGGSAVPNYT